jgi:diguanylate cyclase (GGDEF)-like protein
VLDVKTLYFAVFLITLILGVAQTFASLSRRFDSWVAWWGAGNLVGGLGVFILVLQPLALDIIVVIAVANALVLASFLLIMTGLERFAGMRSNLLLYVAIVVLLFAAMTLPGNQSLFWRRVLALVCDLLIDLRILQLLSRIASRERLLAAKLVGGLFAVSLCLFLFRGYQLFNGVSAQDMLTNTPTNVRVVLCWIFVVPGWNMGLMLMASERMRHNLLELARRDPLTGVLNRAGLTAALEAILAEPGGRHLPLTLLLVDLDHFKAINDRHGHAAGDLVLKMFADTARDHLRSGDILARQGGDEFAIVLPGLTERRGCQIADRLREEFAQASAKTPFGVQVTLTVGVATCSESPVTLDGLFNAADKSLYRAKEDGRNRVVWLPASGH